MLVSMRKIFKVMVNFYLNGILVQSSGSGFVYQKSEVDPSKIYHIKQSNGIYSSVSILVLFDENDEIIQIIPYDYPTVNFDKYFIFICCLY